MPSANPCGAHFILHSAGFLDGLLSLSDEKFMMDADLCGSLHSYPDGVVIDDNTLAVDAFAGVGPGNRFFGCSDTMANDKTAFRDAALSDNEPFEKWAAGGAFSSPERANLGWKKQLAGYEAPPLDTDTDTDTDTDEALPDVIARRKADMADAWY